MNKDNLFYHAHKIENVCECVCVSGVYDFYLIKFVMLIMLIQDLLNRLCEKKDTLISFLLI
jgi:hypothetical protein